MESFARLLFYLVLMCYGATIVILVQQWTTVGEAASWFRVIAWQITLLYVVVREAMKR